MKRFLFVMSAVLGIQAFLSTPPSWGQAPGRRPGVNPNYRPAVSPYLNLFRRGQTPALNYYNLVLPEIEFRRNIGDLQQQITAGQQSLSELEGASGLPTTGHPVQFMNHGKYFLNTGGNRPGGAQFSRSAGATSAPRTSTASRPPTRGR